MKIEELTVRQKVYHPYFGEGQVVSITLNTVEVGFRSYLQTTEIISFRDTVALTRETPLNFNRLSHLSSKPIKIIDEETFIQYRKAYENFHNITEEEENIT